MLVLSQASTPSFCHLQYAFCTASDKAGHGGLRMRLAESYNHVIYKALSLCIEGTHADDMPLQPILEISTDVADMAVHLTEYFQKQWLAYNPVINDCNAHDIGIHLKW